MTEDVAPTKCDHGRGICKVDGCKSFAFARGWCTRHYDKWRNHGDPLRSGVRTGNSKCPGYRNWQAMMTRCHNPKSKDFPGWGGRGIIVCERWRDFALFLADMGPPPGTGYSIERQDNHGNYEPGNCRWATAREQGLNKRNNYFAPGVDPRAVCRAHGVNYGTFRSRVAKGLTIWEALRAK